MRIYRRSVLKKNPQFSVPVSIQATSARPDMVVIRGLQIAMMVLTVPYNSGEMH